MTLLQVEGLDAGYGPVDVLTGVDLVVDEGEIVVVLGANGAGKTTMMRALSGAIARSGRIELDGRSITRCRPDEIDSSGVALVPQGRGTFTELTEEENLRLGGYRRPSDEVEDDLRRWCAEFPVLSERKDQPAGVLSGGEQQMLAVARAVMSRPRLLLLDEPSLGLAPLITQDLFRIIEELNRTSGIAVLLVEQNVNLAMSMADRVYLLETGRIVASGTPSEMSADDSIRMAYLGY
jgi:branched-chain amino acid transport system ATP-binding protein